MRRILLLLSFAVAGCSQAPRWTGYLFAHAGEGAVELHGPYATLPACRADLLRARGARREAGLVCGLGCPDPVQGEISGCRATQVVAVEPKLS